MNQRVDGDRGGRWASLFHVALIDDLDESTVSRLWSDPGWLNRANGSSLQLLNASLPGWPGDRAD